MISSQTILLAEDNEDDVCIMRNAFEHAGVTNPVHSVYNGEQAIAYLMGSGEYSDRDKFPFPLVLFLDLNMPKKDGLEVLAWIRQQPAMKRLTVHILTASNRSADVERAFELGANGYLIKPGRFQQLVELLKAWHTMTQHSAFPQLQPAAAG